MSTEMIELMKPALSGLRPYHQSLRSDVVHFIRDEIFNGQLLPGMKIDQEHISDVLGVSRIPIREALILLESEGLVESRPRKGTFVTNFTVEDIFDHYEVLVMVSSLIVRRATERMSEAQLEQMASSLEQARRASSPAEREACDRAFHRIIDETGASRRVRFLYRSLASSLPSRIYHRSSARAAASHREHVAQLEAFIARDPNRAVAAVTEHIRASRDFAVQMLTERGVFDDPLPTR